MKPFFFLLLLIPSASQLQTVATFPLDSSGSGAEMIALQNEDSQIDSLIVLENVHTAQFLSQQIPSPLLNHLEGMELINNYQTARNRLTNSWMAVILFVMLVMLSIIRFAYNREFSELSTVFKHWGANEQVFRELIGGISAGTILFNIFSVMSVSFYLFLFITHASLIPEVGYYILFAGLLVTVAAYMLIRYIVLNVAAAILPFHKEIKLFNFYEMEANRLLGVLLFPILLVISFAPEPVTSVVWYVSYVLVALVLLIRYIKGLNIARDQFGKSLAHFFLYICTLEIAPVLIIIRLISGIGIFDKA